MKMRSYKLELKLNKNQRTLCAKSAGTSRFAYNWMLGNLAARYEANKALATMYGLEKVPSALGTAIDWNKEWVKLKSTPGYEWTKEVSKCCGSNALRDLEVAYKRFFKKLSKYPKFKKKGQKDSFLLDSNVFISSDYIQLPKLGKVRLKEKCYPILGGKVKLSQATVSRTADRWYVSFFIQEGPLPELPNISSLVSSDILGVDLGIKELAITSDGQSFENPKAYATHLKRLKRYQRRMARKKPGSNNKKKSQMRLAKLHQHVANVRKDTVHKITHSLVNSGKKVIVIESLKPKNMSKNHKLASSILDSAFGMIKETLKYKCAWNGIRLIFAPQFYASSKYCSNCGAKNNDLTLSDREWTCPSCNHNHDRDVNAALNLKYFGEYVLDLGVSSTTVSSTGCNACGGERLQFLTEQCSSMKQEFKSIKLAQASFNQIC